MALVGEVRSVRPRVARARENRPNATCRTRPVLPAEPASSASLPELVDTAATGRPRPTCVAVTGGHADGHEARSYRSRSRAPRAIRSERRGRRGIEFDVGGTGGTLVDAVARAGVTLLSQRPLRSPRRLDSLQLLRWSSSLRSARWLRSSSALWWMVAGARRCAERQRVLARRFDGNVLVRVLCDFYQILPIGPCQAA